MSTPIQFAGQTGNANALLQHVLDVLDPPVYDLTPDSFTRLVDGSDGMASSQTDVFFFSFYCVVYLFCFYDRCVDA